MTSPVGGASGDTISIVVVVTAVLEVAGGVVVELIVRS
jgi:hypothetical protein